MTPSTLSLTCTSCKEQDRLIVKSLVAIAAQTHTGSGKHWIYVADGPADVALMDLDDDHPVYPPRHPGHPLPLIVDYSSDPERLTHSAFALRKPARARDFVQLLSMLDGYLGHQNDRTVPSMPALQLG